MEWSGFGELVTELQMTRMPGCRHGRVPRACRRMSPTPSVPYFNSLTCRVPA